MADILKLHHLDNVAVVVRSAGLTKGEVVSGFRFPLSEDISQGHKFAINFISQGQAILKFGHSIGNAVRDIEPGEHVHIHNVEVNTDKYDFTNTENHLKKLSTTNTHLPEYFLGYARKNGTRAGIRNYVVVVASVNCSASVVKAVCQHFYNRDLSFKNIDGIVPVAHSSGCAQAIGGLGYQILNRTLAGWVFHPNVVGAVVIGLGCEGTTFTSIIETSKNTGHFHNLEIETFGIQDVGGTAAAIAEGIARVEAILERLPRFERTEIPVRQLNLALNCGGSDAFSSITANPTLGHTSDILISKGGTASLAEIPECYGTEGLLYQRASNSDVRNRLVRIFDWWQDYASRNQINLNNNLAPGNIAGGITTIVEKSLGAVTKAGSSALTEVVDYAEPIVKAGFALMNTPGFDPVSVTGLVAGGAQLVAFTTGRGSVYGCSIAPTIKIATNSDVFNRMRGDMDINAGLVLETATIEEIGEVIYRFIIEVANGTQTKSESLKLGWEEFVPWPIAETL